MKLKAMLVFLSVVLATGPSVRRRQVAGRARREPLDLRPERVNA
jgi:hypothetical protein